MRRNQVKSLSKEDYGKILHTQVILEMTSEKDLKPALWAPDIKQVCYQNKEQMSSFKVMYFFLYLLTIN